MPYFTHDENRFHYCDEGEGRPLLFLHGLGASLSQPVELFEGLPDVRLLSLDFRGHGLTEYQGPPSAYQIPVLAGDAAALLDHCKLERVVLGGLSLGAAVALNAALRQPDRVAGLILVRPAWLNHPYPVNLDLVVRIGRWVQLRGVTEARDKLLADDNFQEIRSRVPGAADALLRQLRRPHVATAYEALMRLPASVPFLHWEELEQIRAPSLVIVNTRDPLHPLDFGRQLASGLPKGELLQVTPRYTDPDQHRRDVRQLVAGFVANIEY